MSIYVNLEMRNNGSNLLQCSAEDVREPRVLAEPKLYQCALDRFTIHKAWLPVFENSATLTVRVIKKSDGSIHPSNLSFAGLVDSNNLMWNHQYFLNALNAAIAAAGASAGVTNHPTMTMDADWKATLDYSAEANFADLYYVEFNEPLYSIFHTFSYSDVLYEQEYFTLTLVNAGTKTSTTAEAVSLSPVSQIFVKSNKMPLVYELTPSSGSATSRNSDSIITDFEFGGLNRYPLQNINYTATTGQYRFHSMRESSTFNTLDFQFYYKTYNNTEFPLYLLPSGSCNIKVLFKRINSPAVV